MEFSHTTVTTIALLKEKTKNFANENISLSVSEDTMTMSVLIEIAALNDADRVIIFNQFLSIRIHPLVYKNIDIFTRNCRYWLEELLKYNKIIHFKINITT